MILDVEKIDPEALYKILIGSILPRPIAWVSTVDQDGVSNLAPFSFFTVASANPPILCFSPGNKEGLIDGEIVGIPKDTLRNIRQTEEFVVNVVSRSLAEKMVQSSGDYPPGVSEFDLAGLTPMPSKMVAPPRVGESMISMECRLHQVIEFGKHPSAGNLVLGRIVCINLDDSVYKKGRVDLDILEPVGRLGGNQYCTVKDRFEVPRPYVG